MNKELQIKSRQPKDSSLVGQDRSNSPENNRGGSIKNGGPEKTLFPLGENFTASSLDAPLEPSGNLRDDIEHSEQNSSLLKNIEEKRQNRDLLNKTI